jgi:hypothetical protein
MGDCITPAQASDIALKDTQRLVGTVAKALAVNSPYINILRGGTFPSGVSDEVRSAVQMPAAPGDSLAIPTFVNDTQICGTTGLQDKTGTVEFTYRLKSKRGFGPRVCVKQGYAAFKQSYLTAEDALAKLITQYINSDVRAQLYLNSASKFVAAAGYAFEDLFTGGYEPDVGILFAPVAPTGPLSFKALHTVARFLKEALFAEMFPASDKGQPHFKFIGSDAAIELFRQELGVKEVLLWAEAGRYEVGGEGLQGYSFETAPAYRGIAFGIDQRSLRASGFLPDGTLNLIDPVITIVNAMKNTAYSKHNPSWLRGAWEVGFLFADGSYERQVPEKYVGEGTFKFAPQLHMGELDWHYVIDNDCNPFGDFGWHKYQITRAYRPIRPQHEIPILYQRCTADLGLEPCTVTSSLPLTGQGGHVSQL